MNGIKTLVVADGFLFCDYIFDEIRNSGYEVESVRTGEEALKVFSDHKIILLGLDLPDVDGTEFCRRVRECSDIPIITYTERDSEVERILILQAGSDDHLIVPCGPREFVAHMEAVMRRYQIGDSGKQEFHCGPLYLNCRAREVYLSGRIIHFTQKEFDLLRLLLSRPDRVVSRREISSEVWGYDAIQNSRTVDTHVNKIRKKLGDNDWVRTIRGIGFRISTPVVDSAAHAGTGLVAASE